MKIEDAHVVVTGAGRGIGEALAREFAANGSQVTLVDRSADAIGAIAEEIGGTAVTADLLDQDARRGLIATIEEAVGPVEVLVNNDSADEVGDFLAIHPDAIERMFTLNAVAPVELTRQVLPGMIERGGGHVVNVSSLGGTATFPGSATLSATRAALTHFTTGLRTELKGLPVDLTSVEAGVVDRDPRTSLESHPPLEAAHRRYRRLGLMRFNTAEEVATATARAVRSGKRYVRLPRRARMFPALAGTPRRMNEMILAGVPRRT